MLPGSLADGRESRLVHCAKVWQHQGVDTSKVSLEGTVCRLFFCVERCQSLLLLVVEVLSDSQLLR
jgi:hypothetical protein